MTKDRAHTKLAVPVGPMSGHRLSVLWRNRHGKKPSSESVSSGKGEACQTGGLKKWFAVSPKAWRHKDYSMWHAKFKRMNNV
jgi:hypothetical protein